MEEEAPSQHTVAELAERFKAPAAPQDADRNQTEKPVRRQPPHPLQLPLAQGNNQEPPSVISPLPSKTKRNSALIEKLQATLALSPTATLPPPKSPGFRLLPPAFPPPSSSSAPVTTETTSSTVTPTSPVTTRPVTEEEGPATFEDPPALSEGSFLTSLNKSRARHSIRRRPPSRRHRKSSSGDELDAVDKTATGGEESEEDGAGGKVFKKEGKADKVEEDKTDTSTCPEENQDHKEDQSKTEPRKDDEKEEGEKGSMGREEEARPSSAKKEEEEEEEEEEEAAQDKNPGEKHKADVTEAATNTESREEQSTEPTTQGSGL